MRRLGFLLACQVALAGVALPVARAQEPRGRYIVVLKKGADATAASTSHGKKYGLETRAVYRHALSGYSAYVPETRVGELRSDPSVASVTRERTFRASAQTTPTGVGRIRATETLNKGTGVNVAVMDTGIDLDHPDLAANIVGGKNCSTGTTYDDGNGHGTHVAGIVAALDNDTGVRGVAPQAKLWAVRVLNNAGSGDETTILCGMDFIDSKSPGNGGPITVANMSLEAIGSDTSNCGISPVVDPFHQAVCSLEDHGVTVVAAAGNSHADLANVLPATYDEVITVSALADWDGQPCALDPPSDDVFATSFSNYASLPADRLHLIGAPGVNIYSTVNGNTYDVMSGTSMAAPHVAGAAALYLAEHPGSTPAQVLAGLKADAEPVNVNFNGECTSGVSHTDPSSLHPEAVVAVPPSVFTVVPNTSAIAPVGVQFAGPVDGVDATNVVLRLAAGGGNLPATVSYNASTFKASVQPATPLLPGEYYKIVVSPSGSTPPTDEDGDPIPETAATFRSALFEEESSYFAGYHWRFVSNASAYGGKLIMDRSKGANATFTFTGSSITWYTMKGPDQGKARVFIDGVEKGIFDNYRSSPQWRVPRTWNLSFGTHTIMVMATGQNNAGATNAYVSVDAFKVGSTLHTNPAALTFWRASSSAVASGGRILLDSSRGSSATFVFRGTGINWRTALGPDQGMAKVYIDGVYKGLVDNYSATRKGLTRSFTGLSNAFHSIRIVVAGARRAASTNYYVNVDAWRVI